MDSEDNSDVYVGCKTGAFKGVKINQQGCEIQNIRNLISISDNDEVASICWGDDEEKEILLGCGENNIRSVKVYDTDCSTFTCSFFCNIGTGKITGISRYNEAILTAVHSGEIKLWRFKEEDAFVIKAGENLERMRHSKENKNIIATGGEEHELKLFDIQKQTQIFVGKNVPHDWLQLRVPVWISDIEFLPSTQQIVTVSRYGHVRLYDPKTQRRPVIDLRIKDEALTTLSVVPREKQVIVGSGKGRMNLVDLRSPAKVLNTYKGHVGGVTGITCSKSSPYVVSVSLDRFLRIHHLDTKELLKSVYLTSKISCMLLRSKFSFPINNKVTKENTQICSNKINENSKVKLQKNNPIISDSDSEYDILFDEMEIIDNKEEDKVITKKRKGVEHSMLKKKLVSDKCSLQENKNPKIYNFKRIKTSNPLKPL